MLSIGTSRAAYALRLARARFERLDKHIKTAPADRDAEHLLAVGWILPQERAPVHP
jgi:hypothetical protein